MVPESDKSSEKLNKTDSSESKEEAKQTIVPDENLNQIIEEQSQKDTVQETIIHADKSIDSNENDDKSTSEKSPITQTKKISLTKLGTIKLPENKSKKRVASSSNHESKKEKKKN